LRKSAMKFSLKSFVQNPAYILIIISVIFLAVGAVWSFNMDLITIGAWGLLLGFVFHVMWLVYRS
jgi:hypothetical protein